MTDPFARFDRLPDGEAVIHIHEDDWGLRNLYPLAAWADVAADLREAQEAGVLNRDPAGFGWTDMHLIEAPALTYVEVGLLLTDATATLEPIMPRVRHFHATVFGAIRCEERDPYGAYDDDDAWCFGLGADCYIKLDIEGAYVKHVWFDVATGDPDALAALRRGFEAIERLVPSFIADYRADIDVPLADTPLLDRYFAMLAESL